MKVRVMYVLLVAVALLMAPAVMLAVIPAPRPNPLAGQIRAVNDAKAASRKPKGRCW